MNIFDRLLLRFGYVRRGDGTTITVGSPNSAVTQPRQYFELMSWYYANNQLYDEITRAYRGMNDSQQGLKALRNPAFRCVEFYAATIWPGTLPDALPLETDNDRIVEPLQQLWKWSNWGEGKQQSIRQMAITGNIFIKVAQKTDGRPYLQSIGAQYVHEFERDDSGFVTFARIDMPQTRKIAGQIRKYTRTEVWSNETQTFSLYEHEMGDAPTENLGAPVSVTPFSDFGIDFVPIAHGKFRAVDGLWGLGAFSQQLDKIDEANRAATRLHQMIYRHNKALWALEANGTGADNRPLPPPKLSNADGSAASDDYMATLGDDAMLRLPGNAKLSSLVPALNYSAALEVLKDHMNEIQDDLPELAYFSMMSSGNSSAAESGKARRIRLAAAIDRAQEVRGNAEGALIRAQMMALTMGQNSGVWKGLGDFDAGDFEHRFDDRDIVALDELDEADLEAKKVATYKAAGVPQEEIWREALGYDDKGVEKLKEEPSYQNLQAALTGLNQPARPGQPVQPGQPNQPGQANQPPNAALVAKQAASRGS